MLTSRIAIFASGNGSNAEAIINYFQDSDTVKVTAVFSNNPNAFALERARKFSIPTRVFDGPQFREREDVLNWLKELEVTHIVLAGFLWLLPRNLLQAFPDRIINIHPALLPRFGGKGMFGMKVHERVKAEGETETGITIHLVNERYDEGKILLQVKCPVDANDSLQEIATKVNMLEYEFYPRVIEEWVVGNR